MKKVLKQIGVFAAVAFSAFSMFVENVVSVSADDTALTNYDKTAVTDDLKEMSGFSTVDYPKKTLLELGEPQVQLIHCAEFCWSDYGYYDEYYGLYLYVYNPTETPITTSGHYVNMAMAYNEKGEPIRYENVPLQFLSASTDYMTKNRFFKFKVKDSVALRERTEKYAEMHEGQRRYDIAGIQLSFQGNDFYEVDSTVARTYYFDGYGKEMSEASKYESTLVSTYDDLYTLKLDVNHTYYRGDFNDEWIAQTLNTAYFSVPDEIFEQYGKRLQKIKAEWYEYKTKEIFVTSDTNVYKKLKPYIGKNLGRRDDELRYRVFWEQEISGSYSSNSIRYDYNKCYNGFLEGKNHYVWKNMYWKEATPVVRMDWLFDVGEVEAVDDYKVPSKMLKEYMTWYTERYPTIEKVKTNGSDRYASSLFADGVDTGRKRGYNNKEFDADSTTSFLFDKEWSYWEGHEDFDGFYDTLLGVYSPILLIEDANELASMTYTDFSKKYFVNLGEAEKVQNYCIQELSAGRKPVLFRFAQTDYYASAAIFDSYDKLGLGEIDGYVAQETVFLDFDIISLTFRNDDNVDTVLAVVSNPTDVINDLDPAPDLTVNNNWKFGVFLEKALIFVGVIAGCVVVYFILRAIIKHFTE